MGRGATQSLSHCPSGAGQPWGHRGDTESVFGAVAGHSRAGGISGAQTSGTRGLEWHPWAGGGLGGAPGKGGHGMKCLDCPKAPSVSYFMENCKIIKKSLLLAMPFK